MQSNMMASMADSLPDLDQLDFTNPNSNFMTAQIKSAPPQLLSIQAAGYSQ